ncbi:MAG: COQ9 family protein [Caulobacteraceae bacterium]|nr:COQ9 family protein [Caulobacteraceae bacterium]
MTAPVPAPTLALVPSPQATPPQGDWADLAEQRLLDAALPLAAARGWSPRLIAEAGALAGLAPGEAELLLPNGPRDLAALMARRLDQTALERLAGIDPKSLKMRERIARAVEARLEAAMAQDGAVRRWVGFLALPSNTPLALRLTWESADVLWRWAGDTATDENHYSKRAILSGILVGALALRLSGGEAAASAFLKARIDNVMAFETWKAGRKPVTVLQDVAEALGRMRYGRG